MKMTEINIHLFCINRSEESGELSTTTSAPEEGSSTGAPASAEEK
jgi:hypothetical protein